MNKAILAKENVCVQEGHKKLCILTDKLIKKIYILTVQQFI